MFGKKAKRIIFVDYAPGQEAIVAELLRAISQRVRFDVVMVEWREGVLNYQAGVTSLPEALRARANQNFADEFESDGAVAEWVYAYAPYSHSAELYSHSLNFQVDIADGDSLSIQYPGSQDGIYSWAIELLRSSGLPMGGRGVTFDDSAG